MNEKKVKQARDTLKEWFGQSDELKVVLGLLEEALAPPVRFYFNQPVIDDEGRPCLYVEPCGDGRHYVKGQTDGCASWLIGCKPDPDAVSLPNWIEHDGSKKSITAHGCVIISEHRDGSISHSISICPLRVYTTRYAIIPLPEFL